MPGPPATISTSAWPPPAAHRHGSTTFTSAGSDPISVTLNLKLTGEFILSGVNSDDEATTNVVGIGVEFGGFRNNGEYRVHDGFNSGYSETSSGLLAGLSGTVIDETIQVTRTVPVNTPVGLNLTLSTQAAATSPATPAPTTAIRFVRTLPFFRPHAFGGRLTDPT